MDAELLKATVKEVGNYGVSGLLICAYILNMLKEKGQAQVIQEQVEDKRIMREERKQLIRMIRDNAKREAKVLAALERVRRTAA